MKEAELSHGSNLTGRSYEARVQRLGQLDDRQASNSDTQSEQNQSNALLLLVLRELPFQVIIFTGREGLSEGFRFREILTV